MLEVRGLHAGYGLARVLEDVSLDASKGAITAVLGANGAGKTTLMRALSGLLPVSSGEVRFAGEDITGLPPEHRVARGLSLVPEGRLVFPDLSVWETLRAGAYIPRARSGWRKRAAEMLDLFPNLAERRDTTAGSLSGGEQQMLAIARGLMSQPRLLMLDEPSLGLAPAMAAQTFAALAEIGRSGVTILLVDQDVNATLDLAGYAYVMENGRLVEEGESATLADSPMIREAYLGL